MISDPHKTSESRSPFYALHSLYPLRPTKCHTQPLLLSAYSISCRSPIPIVWNLPRPHRPQVVRILKSRLLLSWQRSPGAWGDPQCMKSNALIFVSGARVPEIEIVSLVRLMELVGALFLWYAISRDRMIKDVDPSGTRPNSVCALTTMVLHICQVSYARWGLLITSVGCRSRSLYRCA